MFGLTISIADSNLIVELFYNEDFTGAEPKKTRNKTNFYKALGVFRDDLQK